MDKNGKPSAAPSVYLEPMPLPQLIGWDEKLPSNSAQSVSLSNETSLPSYIHLCDFYSAMEEQEAILSKIKCIFSSSSLSLNNPIDNIHPLLNKLPSGYLSQQSLRSLDISSFSSPYRIGVFFKTQYD